MRVGIIGAGFFGEKHALAITSSAGLELVAASRSDKHGLEAFTAKYGGTQYDDYREVLADPSVDAVAIATPHATHQEIAVAAARAGKHILLEKPMAPTAAGCQAIVAAAKQYRVTLMLGHVTRFSRAFRIAKDLLESGELGEPVAGLSIMRKAWLEPNRRSWHLDRAQGGGVLLTGGIHAVDRLTWLLGAQVASVSAQLGTRFHDQQADDLGVIFLRYANGAAGCVYSVGYGIGAPEHGTEITCTKGVLRVHSVSGVSIGRNESWTSVPDSGSSDWMSTALIQEWQEFRRAVESGTEPLVSGEEAHHVMKAVFAAEASSATGREVAVD